VSTTDVHILKGSWTRGGWTYAGGIANHVRRCHLHFDSVIGLDPEGFEEYQDYQDHSIVLLVKREGESNDGYSILDSICGVELKTCDSSCRLTINDLTELTFDTALDPKMLLFRLLCMLLLSIGLVLQDEACSYRQKIHPMLFLLVFLLVD